MFDIIFDLVSYVADYADISGVEVIVYESPIVLWRVNGHWLGRGFC